ncbi:MAG: sensor histidine kinase [Oscillospiraceae bacterium]|nr:sensor histidine kinase [Oscillospiraceae bacterium]
MHQIIDKIALLLFSGMTLFRLGGLAEPVLILLFAVILSELTHILPERTAIVPGAVYSVCCLFVPHMALMLPLFVYDILRLKKYPVLIISALSFAAVVPALTAMQIFSTLLSAAFSALLNFRTSYTQELQKKLTEQRDRSEEIKILMAEKNRSLVEKQDNDIYMATLKERNRIAREIHDNVGHSLTRTILQMGALRIINKDESLNETIDSIKDSLDNAMTSIRSSVYDLHNTTVDLKRLIQECASHLNGRFTVKLDYNISENTHVNIKLCLLGIVKEAVSNITKHSKGDAVSIALREHPAFYQLIISDNGGNAGEIKNTGMGLASMRERAENAGGIFNVTSSQNEFRIFATIPKSK